MYIPEDTASGEPDRIRELAALHGHAPETGWRKRKDGELIFVDGEAAALKDEAGYLLGFSKVMRDATPWKLAGEERDRLLSEWQATVKRLQAVMNQMPEALTVAEAPGGNILLHNQAAVKLFGDEKLPFERSVPGSAQHPDGSEYKPEEYPIVRAARR